MAGNASMVEKKKVLYDGVEVEGLVSVSEVTLEDGIVEVPSFNQITKIGNEITTMPEVTLTYQVKRNGSALKFFQDFHRKHQQKDVIVIRTDASGLEFARDLLSQCECTKDVTPEFDAANPTYSKIQLNLLPKGVDSVPAA